MPELPEVETIRRDLNECIVGKEIASVVLSATKVVRGAREQFASTLVGRHVAGIGRIGKLLMFDIGGAEYTLLVHLKMTGQLIYRADKSMIADVAGGHSFANQPFMNLPDRHTRAEISFADASRLFFNDMRMFGYMELVRPERLAQIRATYGIEPGTPGFTADAFRAVFSGRNAPVKALLLNQRLIAGVGNIYADEACFRAGIRPGRRAGALTKREMNKLCAAVDAVIAHGVRERGTTFRNFVDGNGNSGGFLKFLRVYGRDGEVCTVCQSTIQKTVCAGRGTHFCPKCQV